MFEININETVKWVMNTRTELRKSKFQRMFERKAQGKGERKGEQNNFYPTYNE